MVRRAIVYLTFVLAIIAYLANSGPKIDKNMRNLAYYSKFSAFYKLEDRPRKMALLIDDMQEEYAGL